MRVATKERHDKKEGNEIKRERKKAKRKEARRRELARVQKKEAQQEAEEARRREERRAAEETAEWAEQQRQMSKLDASADALQAEEKERRALISADRKPSVERRRPRSSASASSKEDASLNDSRRT